MEKVQSLRRKRFLKVSPKRVDKVIRSLDSLGKTSERSNYEFHQYEIDSMYLKILSQINNIFILFGDKGPEHKLNRFLQADLLQYETLRKQDPETFKLVEQKVGKGFSFSQTNLSSKEDEQDLNEIEEGDYFRLNPDFDLSRLIAEHNKSRLMWIGAFGRTGKDLMSPDSPYNHQPSGGNYKKHINWDIKEKRVIHFKRVRG